jgi:hypothetical protein
MGSVEYLQLDQTLDLQDQVEVLQEDQVHQAVLPQNNPHQVDLSLISLVLDQHQALRALQEPVEQQQVEQALVLVKAAPELVDLHQLQALGHQMVALLEVMEHQAVPMEAPAVELMDQEAVDPLNSNLVAQPQVMDMGKAKVIHPPALLHPTLMSQQWLQTKDTIKIKLMALFITLLLKALELK